MRLAKLKSLVDYLQRQVADLTAAKVQTEAELKTTQAMAKSAAAAVAGPCREPR